MKHGYPTIEGDLRHEIEAHRRRDVLDRVAKLAHDAAKIPIVAQDVSSGGLISFNNK